MTDNLFEVLDKAGVDGIIVQDMAVALLARRVVPDLPFTAVRR